MVSGSPEDPIRILGTTWRPRLGRSRISSDDSTCMLSNPARRDLSNLLACRVCTGPRLDASPTRQPTTRTGGQLLGRPISRDHDDVNSHSCRVPIDNHFLRLGSKPHPHGATLTENWSPPPTHLVQFPKHLATRDALRTSIRPTPARNLGCPLDRTLALWLLGKFSAASSELCGGCNFSTRHILPRDCTVEILWRCWTSS